MDTPYLFLQDFSRLFAGAGHFNPAARNIADGATDEEMLQLTLAASSRGDVTITQIDFDMSGSGDESTDLTSARLYRDVDNNGKLNDAMDVQIGSTVTSFTDNGTISFSGISETINSNEAENWLVVYDFDGTGTDNGETFDVTLTANGDITHNGAAAIGAPVAGGLGTISATGTLTLSEGANNPSASNISATATKLVMLQVNLAAGQTEAVDISSITFTSAGSANESTDIDSVRLINDINNDGFYLC